MSKPSISQPSAKTYTVVDLVASALEGRIRIPEFQRPLRWQWEDVRRLFDSIVKGYPIGNLLLWKRLAPAGSIKLGGLRIESRQFDEGWWVVDGQQRLTSLANALSDGGMMDERFALAYDLRKQVFVHPGRDDDGHIVPLPVLFDLQRLIRWFTKDYPEASDSLDEASRVTRVIREYHVPAYLVDQDDEAILRDIFDRMNNYGKRLSRAEVFSALHFSGSVEAEPSLPFQRIAETIHDERGFGIVDSDTVLRAVLARRGSNVSREIRDEFVARQSRDFNDESPQQAYSEGEKALLRAVLFLQENAGTPHFAFLPFRYLLVVLARFFAHFPEPEPRNRLLLRRWYWRAALVGPGPFNSSWTRALDTLAAQIKVGEESDSVQRLLDCLGSQRLPAPSLAGFKTNSANGRIVLSALWELKPRSLLTGEPCNRQQLTQALQDDATLRDVTQRFLNREPEDKRLWAANRLLMLESSEELPASVVDLLVTPQLDCAIHADEILASHALDKKMLQALVEKDKSAFLDARQQCIAEVVKHFIERMAETQLEDTPPLDSFDLDEMDAERDDALS
ncbi:MAG: DUF262 domain-containing protein [Methylovulum miyakonense]|uniref:DUF262 domain-containing protein n=1 Tax=Methylovulum miyakonense TaxID=645578 RepID=UPI003BB70084